MAETPFNNSAFGVSDKSCLTRFGPFLQFALAALFTVVALFVFLSHRESQHIGFVSATYYRNSSIYPPNTVVLLFNSQRTWYPQKSLVCESWNGSASVSHTDRIVNAAEDQRLKELARVRYAHMANLVCGWTPFIAVCRVVEEPTGLTISDTWQHSQPVQVPVRSAVRTQLDVVACFSPLFYNERWQLILPSLEIYRQYGVALQVYYIQSIRDQLHRFLRAYKAAGVVEIEPWTLMDLGPEHVASGDPNKELEWRNQAAAHTDCFLKYREAAEFIIVSDVDDVLIPRIGNTYLDEFRTLSFDFPFAAGYTYHRYNTALTAPTNPLEFDLQKVIESAAISNQWEDGKSIIRTSRVQTVWLHWPGIVEPGFSMVTVPKELNFMVHMRNWTISNVLVNVNLSNVSNNLDMRRPFHMYPREMEDLIRPSRASELQLEFSRFVHRFAHTELAELPQDVVYYPLIEACYNRIFYSKAKRPDSCPGPILCDLPASMPGVPCAVAHRNIAHRHISSHLEVHFGLSDGGFVVHPDGCRM